MGHSSKFVFPLPGRKQKPAASANPPAISGPLTKVQKILGTAEVNEDSGAAPADSRWAWEHESNSGISVSVSETTAGHTHRGIGQPSGHDGWATAQRERRWEDESDIIPPALNRQTMTGSMVHDMTTDVSSLRRRQSSSTITSFYDKSKLPLSISQQTSNSAMAKGLPSKAHALLDFDGEFPTEPKALKKKKPSRLDLSSLLQKHKSSKLLYPEPHKEQVLGSDMLTKSPSVMSVSPAATPPPIPQRADRTQSRSNPHSGRGGPAGSGKQQPTKANIDLYNLYDHYEQRTFADAMDQELHETADYRLEQPATDQRPPAYPTPPASNSGTTYLSPFPPNPSRMGHTSKQAPTAANLTEATLKGAANLSSPVSTPADCASVSSRHTRTSKASKRTDRSLTDIDLLQNSVLALSSDSEDDYELSSKGSLAVPPLSDGQPSPTSPRSAASQRAEPQDGSRNKPVKHTSFAESPQFFPAKDVAAAKGPQIGVRSSSLNSKSSTKQAKDLARQTSRLSIGTTSTDRTVSRVSSQSSGRQRATVTKKTSRSKLSDKLAEPSMIKTEFDFPAPPLHRSQQPVSRASEQSPPLSPSSLDLALQSHRLSTGHDTGSIRSSTSLGSAIMAGRRGSATSSINDGSSGRFMAVTRQEEMLLAALRLKRARMREDIIAEFEEEMDREDHHQLKREMTNESISTNGCISRQSSRGTMRLETGMLSARPRQPGAKEPDDPAHETTTELGADLEHFLRYGDSLSPGGCERRRSRSNSTASQKSAGGRQRASLTTTAGPRSRPQRRDGSLPRRGPEQVSPKGQKDLPHQILEDLAEDEEADIPRPDSPISPSDFPAPVSMASKKQVRLSAVGYYKPNIEAGWWNDSG
ncbi:hypothetical protein MFIFM68171_05620 [Madurella fahalii]|uniref:Uncharacterized protein n=1 Tax=Madurella fahalii TaxID=1157608 RepID=A0ABQ0GCD5_9PEZI